MQTPKIYIYIKCYEFNYIIFNLGQKLQDGNKAVGCGDKKIIGCRK